MKIQRDTLLGLVFFGGLALIGWATVSLTSWSLEPKPELIVHFRNAAGLRKGDQVFVLGKRIGQITEVAWDTSTRDTPIRIAMAMDEEIALFDDKRIEIRDASLLGGSQIEIDPGVSGIPAMPPLFGETRGSPLESLGEADLEGTAAAIKRFFDKLTDPNGSVGALLESRRPFDDLAASLDSLRRSLEEVERAKGPLGRVIYSEEMADDLSQSMHNLRELTHRVTEGTGLIARLVNDPELASDVAGALSDLHELTDRTRRGQGVLGRLFSDDIMAQDVAATLKSLRSVSAKLDDADGGLLGALIGDSSIREDAKRLVANLSQVSEQLRTGRGPLGRLINDEHLGERIERIINQVAGAIEDAREAAPVGNFINVLAGPF